jgi:hypothetical protein
VYVHDLAGDTLTSLLTISNNTRADNWTRFSTTIPQSFAGKKVDIGFFAITNSSKRSSFFVDTAALDVVGCF